MRLLEERAVGRLPQDPERAEVVLGYTAHPHIWHVIAECLLCARYCCRHQGDRGERDTQAALLRDLTLVWEEERQ